MDAYDMTETTKCAVVIMMTWTEKVLLSGKLLSFMLTYMPVAWITTKVPRNGRRWDRRGPMWPGKEMFDSYDPILMMF
jgi:hypothetical protein